MPPKPRISPAARKRLNGLLSRYTGYHLVRDASSHKPVKPAVPAPPASGPEAVTPSDAQPGSTA